tara:strand:- start:549 stop:1085 length:537 start_codon:yes stop_codon:yes gene_type:complete
MGQDQPELPGWGVYGGIVMANASGDSLDGTEAVSLPGFGISKGVMLGGLPMQVGVGIHGRGYHMDSDGMHVELKANYLDLWAQVPYPVGPVFLGLGFNVGSFIGGTQKVEAEFYGLEISEEADLESDALGLDFGLNLGVAYPIGDTGAQVGALYVLGLAEPADGIKFNGLFLNAGYSF